MQDFQSWQDDVLAPYGMYLQPERVDWSAEDVKRELLPLTAPIATRFVFIATRSPWTAYFDNYLQGTDAASVMRVMAGRLRCEAMRVESIDQTLPGDPTRDATGDCGAVILEVYDSHADTRRSVYAANDGGKWVFGQSGEPFSFEDVEAYRRRRVRERFTTAMLVRYLEALDAHPFDKEWYANDAVVLRKEGNLPKLREKYPEAL